MSDQTVFGSTSTASSPDKGVLPNNGNGDNTNSVVVLVGEGRKYRTVDDLAKAYMEADGFIEKLKDENRIYKEEAVKAKTIDDVLARLKQPTSATADDIPVTNKPAAPAFSPQDVAAIVKAEITGYETAKTREGNILKADAEMKKLFGEKAQEVFNAQAKDPATKQALQSLAEVAPDQFIALFTKGGVVGGSTTHSTINTGALDLEATGDRAANPNTKEYFTALRRKSPQVYYSTQTQLAMNKAAQANPKLFFGHDLDMSLGS